MPWCAHDPACSTFTEGLLRCNVVLLVLTLPLCHPCAAIAFGLVDLNGGR